MSLDTTARNEWLTERRNGIGGSDVAAIIGLSPWQSAYSLWANKVGLTPDNDQTEAMEFGLRAEPMLTEWLQDRLGITVHGVQRVAQHPEYPWHRCTLDGELPDAVIEFKTTSASADEWADGVPVHYQCQAQWAMHVTGHPRCIFGVLHLAFDRVTFRTYTLDRDNADIALLVAAVDAFWLGHVVTGIAPDTDGSKATTEALKAWEANPDLCLEATADLIADCEIVRACKAEIKALEEQQAGAENRIKAALTEATTLTCGADTKGRPVVLATWNQGARNSIDTKRLRAEQPDIATEYTNTTTTRSLLVKQPKGDK